MRKPFRLPGDSLLLRDNEGPGGERLWHADEAAQSPVSSVCPPEPRYSSAWVIPEPGSRPLQTPSLRTLQNYQTSQPETVFPALSFPPETPIEVSALPHPCLPLPDHRGVFPGGPVWPVPPPGAWTWGPNDLCLLSLSSVSSRGRT